MSIIIQLLVSSMLVFSALPHKQRIAFKKTSKYMLEGQFYGGQSGRGFSLLSVRRKLSKYKTVDRVILDFGDLHMNPLIGKAPYVHVSVENSKNRVSVDLFQTHQSKYNFQAIKDRLTSSPFVQSSQVIFDPTSGDMSLVMTTKQPLRVEAFFMKSKTKATRLALDLVPIKK